jgi:hypothetical protein
MIADSNTNPGHPPPTVNDVRPFRDLQTTGLLWFLNRTVFHPRGFALGMVTNNDDPSGEYIGWALLGDGCEVWRFDDTVDEDGYLRSVSARLGGAS